MLQSAAVQHELLSMHVPLHSFLLAVLRFVSQPFDGSPSQSAKPAVQASVQLLLHVPLTALQQVAPHTLLPVLSVYEQLPPTPLHEPAVL
jgi:hypothetical protein